MRAVRFDRFGSPSEVLRVQDVPTPVADTGEVLVRIRAAGVNPSDVGNVAGRFGHSGLPRTPGRDFAGTVESGPAGLVGQDVWGSGDSGFTRDGTHAEFVLLPASAVRSKPSILSWEQAAAVGVPFVTAWAALVMAADMQAGETVFVVGAAGAVGSAATQIARWQGVQVIGGVRDPGRTDKSDNISFVSTEPPAQMAEHVRARTGGRGADIVFATVNSASLFSAALACVRDGGRMVVISTMDESVPLPLREFYRRDLSLHGVNSLRLNGAQCALLLERMTPGFETGALRPPVTTLFPLEQAAAAYEFTGGKAVLIPF